MLIIKKLIKNKKLLKSKGRENKDDKRILR